MPSSYNKPHLTFEQQLELIKSRGLSIADEPRAISYLQRIGYYRLSAYWYPFRLFAQSVDAKTKKVTIHRSDNFRSDCSFQHVLDLYVFDKRLRLVVLDAIERIEVAFRVDISYLLGSKNQFAHTDPLLLHGNFSKKKDSASGKTRHQKWMEKHDEAVARSKEDFVTHYEQKYGLPLPIWVSVEIWDLGMLSTFYQGMNVADKLEIANKYNVDWQVLETWLRSINFVRNVAAHHSRLWNKNLIDQPKLPKIGDIPEFDTLCSQANNTSRLYVALCILIYLTRRVCPNSSWSKRLKDLIKSFPTVPKLTIADMGFPSDWESQPFWQEHNVKNAEEKQTVFDEALIPSS